MSETPNVLTVKELAHFPEIFLDIASSCLFFPQQCTEGESPTMAQIHEHIYGGTNGCSRCRTMARDKIQFADLREQERAEEEFEQEYGTWKENSSVFFDYLLSAESHPTDEDA